MSFSINTNIASLESQQYLQQTNNYLNRTVQEVTSGLRIVNSGDDAAGLAIANGYRTQEAVLTQGIQNANDGLSQSDRRWRLEQHFPASGPGFDAGDRVGLRHLHRRS